MFGELDVDAVVARRPEVVLVDELAHTNVPGSRNAKRWQDVEEILEAGIDVVSTLNVQHLESLADAVEEITGVAQRETLPDEVVRRDGQVELVDMAPEALRRRMAHGNVYAPERVDAALSKYFRLGNLTALRELALLWVAGEVGDSLGHYRSEHRVAGVWETRERVVVALAGGPEGETLVRRAARIAARSPRADLLAVHVTRADGPANADPARLARQRALVESLGGGYHQVVGDDVPRALLDFSRRVNATQLVLGVSRRGWLARTLSRGVGVTTAASSGTVDVHMITHEEAGRPGGRGPSRAALTRSRRLAGWGTALLGLPLLTAVLLGLSHATLPSVILLFLLMVVCVALAGGMWPAITAAVAGFALLNWYFTPPFHSLAVTRPENLLALVVYVLVAVMVSAVVDLAARRAREAALAGAEAEVLATLAGYVLRGEAALPSLLSRLREVFGLASVTLLERRPDGSPAPPGPGGSSGSSGSSGASGPGGPGGPESLDGSDGSDGWRIVATGGGEPSTRPGVADTDVVVDDDLVLAVRGWLPGTSGRRVLEAFAAEAAVALRHQRLAEQAERLRPLAEADRMRTALLAAVSHDLRTPLASAKAAVEGLRATDVDWSPEDRAELLATADESLVKLDRLVANLLDMSRLQAGVLGLTLQPTALEDIVPRVVDELGPPYDRVLNRLPEDLPEIAADPALLERVLVNLVSNAVRYSPPGVAVLVGASMGDGGDGGDGDGDGGEHVEIRVVDRGPGIPEESRDRVFMPFQRLGDRDNATGVGLGLALSRGLAEAMGGTLVPDETPGGGLTMVLTLPVFPRHRAAPVPVEDP
ncbi:sensor histidine kinase KdpD [Streptosporangium vulgare]